MAGGWTRDGAVQDQIDDSVADAVLAARASIPSGASEPFCAICGDDIPEGRRRAMPGVAHMPSDHLKAFGTTARGLAARNHRNTGH